MIYWWTLCPSRWPNDAMNGVYPVNKTVNCNIIVMICTWSAESVSTQVVRWKMKYCSRPRTCCSTQKVGIVCPPLLVFLSGVHYSTVGTVSLWISVWTAHESVHAQCPFSLAVLTHSEISKNSECQGDELRSNEAVFLQSEIEVRGRQDVEKLIRLKLAYTGKGMQGLRACMCGDCVFAIPSLIQCTNICTSPIGLCCSL